MQEEGEIHAENSGHTGTLGRRPSRKLLMVPKSPSCHMWKASLSTLVRFNISSCAWATSIFANTPSRSSCLQVSISSCTSNLNSNHPVKNLKSSLTSSPIEEVDGRDYHTETHSWMPPKHMIAQWNGDWSETARVDTGVYTMEKPDGQWVATWSHYSHARTCTLQGMTPSLATSMCSKKSWESRQQTLESFKLEHSLQQINMAHFSSKFQT